VAVLAHGTQEHKKADSNAQPVLEQTAWGIAGTPTKIDRTVKVVMSDNMRFEPSSLQFKEGETVKFIVKNEGKLMHEFVLGTKDKNLEHADLMKKFPNMEHEEPYMAHVAPGKTTEMVWTFNRSGEFEFACLIAGHFDAGMRGPLRVAKSSGAEK
jgi:uncharacterized cupredoxin-like copper-binding protein